MTEATLDRRRFFLGSVSVSAAVLLGGELGTALAVSPAAAARVPLSGHLGHVDDMWGHWPPYAHPIPYPAGAYPAGAYPAAPYPTAAGEAPAQDGLDPADRQWGSGS